MSIPVGWSNSRIQFVFMGTFTILKHFAPIISSPRGVYQWNKINIKEHPRSSTKPMFFFVYNIIYNTKNIIPLASKLNVIIIYLKLHFCIYQVFYYDWLCKVNDKLNWFVVRKNYNSLYYSLCLVVSASWPIEEKSRNNAKRNRETLYNTII